MNPAHPADVPRFVVSVDTVIFGFIDKRLHIPLLLRNDADPGEPFPDCWSLAGGPMRADETPEQACRRKLEQDIGLKIEYLEQLYTFAGTGRDPRGRTVSIAYYALILATDKPLIWGADAKAAKYFPLGDLPPGPWAFDHQEIVETAVTRLRAKLSYEPVGFNLLPREFGLPDLKALYEGILGRTLDRRNFYKKIKSTGLLIPTRTIPSARGKPTQLYRFDAPLYRKLKKQGFAFEGPSEGAR